MSRKSKLTVPLTATDGAAVTYVELSGITVQTEPVVVENSCLYWLVPMVAASVHEVPPAASLDFTFNFSVVLPSFCAVCV